LTVTLTRISGFLCPSDSPPNWLLSSASAPLPNYTAPGNNYFASVGSSLEFASRQTAGPPNGPFSYIGEIGKNIRLSDIRDGTSNTVAYGEWRTGDGNSNIITLPTDIVFIGTLPAGTARNNGTLTMPNPTLVANFPAWSQTCSAALGPTGSTTRVHSAKLDLRHLRRQLRQPASAAQSEGPELRLVDRREQHPAKPRHVGLSSYHPAARTRFPRRVGEIHQGQHFPPTLWAIASYAQGEVVSSDSY